MGLPPSFFLEHGAKVAVADINEDSGKQLIESLPHEHAAFFKTDITNESDCQKPFNPC
ncbi:hypothetical protein BsIDN1_66270 [Bacillus safensis]|uniref:3-hydroxyacyl-CoA dehydrogenase NAD binding domain-containing protein n=1 Tax=Bacillus safensis TaxID=561879 RepID=A0A5S9MM07_BACIA|nr:hypothetical protein BsIDN1_66270 [Bacillus safensis]